MKKILLLLVISMLSVGVSLASSVILDSNERKVIQTYQDDYMGYSHNAQVFLDAGDYKRAYYYNSQANDIMQTMQDMLNKLMRKPNITTEVNQNLTQMYEVSKQAFDFHTKFLALLIPNLPKNYIDQYNIDITVADGMRDKAIEYNKIKNYEYALGHIEEAITTYKKLTSNPLYITSLLDAMILKLQILANIDNNKIISYVDDIADYMFKNNLISSYTEKYAYIYNQQGVAYYMLGDLDQAYTSIDRAVNNDLSVSVFAKNKLSIDELRKSIDFLYTNQFTKYADGKMFRYNDYITREQASKFFVKLAEMNRVDKIVNDNCNFKDAKEIDSTLKDYVVKACQYGIMKGGNGLFTPRQQLTLGQIVTIVSRILDGNKYDMNTNEYWTSHMKNLNNKGITITLMQSNNIQPTDFVRRGMVGQYIYQTYNYMIAE